MISAYIVVLGDVFVQQGCSAVERICSVLCPNADLRHGLIGAGVYASHGYERSHRDGAENTLKVLAEYIG